MDKHHNNQAQAAQLVADFVALRLNDGTKKHQNSLSSPYQRKRVMENKRYINQGHAQLVATFLAPRLNREKAINITLLFVTLPMEASNGK